MATLLVCVPTSVFAQSYNPQDALSLKLGETDLYPSVRIDYRQNNNAFLQSSNAEQASSGVISPELVWVANRRLVEIVGSYEGVYNSSSEDALTFANHALGLEANAELNSRRRVRGELSLDFDHDEVGTNFTLGNSDSTADAVQFTHFEAEGAYRYGADQAKGNLEFGLRVQNRSYTNRRDVTSGRNYSYFEPFAEFSYRLSGDTRAVSELRFASVTFGNKNRDRNDLSLLLGMQFAATGKTGGGFRVGALQSQPKSAGNSVSTEFVVSANLFWEPSTFSRFDFRLTRELDNEGGLLVNANSTTGIRDIAVLDWNHEWSSRVSHFVRLISDARDNTCLNLDNNRVSATVELNVQVRRWLSVGVSGDSAVSDYNNCGNTDINYDYERARFGAHIRATL